MNLLAGATKVCLFGRHFPVPSSLPSQIFFSLYVSSPRFLVFPWRCVLGPSVRRQMPYLWRQVVCLLFCSGLSVSLSLPPKLFFWSLSCCRRCSPSVCSSLAFWSRVRARCCCAYQGGRLAGFLSNGLHGGQRGATNARSAAFVLGCCLLGVLGRLGVSWLACGMSGIRCQCAMSIPGRCVDAQAPRRCWDAVGPEAGVGGQGP